MLYVIDFRGLGKCTLDMRWKGTKDFWSILTLRQNSGKFWSDISVLHCILIQKSCPQVTACLMEDICSSYYIFLHMEISNRQFTSQATAYFDL